MSQHRSRLINGAALVALIAVAGCQPPAQTAAPTGATAPAAPAYELLAARQGKKPAEPAPAASPDPCAQPTYAVIANNPNAIFHMSGTRNTIEGSVWTNDGIKMAGNREVITGDAHFRDDVTISGNSNYIAGQKARESANGPWAFATVEQLMATGPVFRFAGDIDLKNAPVWEAPGVLKSGVYYSNGKINLSTNGVRGRVTLIAQSVQLPGKSHNLEAYAEGVLAYALAYGANALHVSGNNGLYAGSFIAPNGEFQLTGNQNTVMGQVKCDSFKLSGGNNRIAISGVSGCPSPAPTPTPTPATLPTPEPTSVVVSPEPSPVGTNTPAPVGTPSPIVEPTSTPSPIVTPTPVASATTAPPSGAPTDFTDDDPMDVIADAGRYIYTANFTGASVTKLTPEGLVAIGTGTNFEVGYKLRGIAFASDGTMWVAAVENALVLHLNANGQVLSNHPVGDGPSRVRIDAFGNVWTPDMVTRTVTKLSPTGVRLGQYAFTESPFDVAFDAAGNTWVSASRGSTGTVTKLSGTDGTVLKKVTLDSAKGPWGITTDVAGNVWVALSNANQVARITQAGVVSYHNVGVKPIGIVADANGNVWVSNNGANTAMRLSSAGAVTATVATGAGPHGISIDNSGRVLVANSLDRSVTIITP